MKWRRDRFRHAMPCCVSSLLKHEGAGVAGTAGRRVACDHCRRAWRIVHDEATGFDWQPLTPPQPDMFDEPRAQLHRDVALDTVTSCADPVWLDRAFEAVQRVALAQPTFSTEHVWKSGLDKPREPRAMGPVMIRALKAGICRKLGYNHGSGMVTRHAAPVMLYESLLFNPRQ